MVNFSARMTMSVVVLMCFLSSVVSAEPQPAQLHFVPNRVCLPAASSERPSTVELRINSSELVIGVECTILFDTSKVRIIGFETGPFLKRNGGDVADFSVQSNGTLTVIQGVGGGDPFGVSGSGTVLLIDLIAAAEDPITMMRFASADLRDPLNHEIEVQTEDLQVRLAGKETSRRFGMPERRYVLISLPLDFPEGTKLSAALQQLGRPGPSTWNGYGLVDDQLVKDPVVSPGRGYWVATAADHDSVLITGFARCDTARVDLGEGWSIIGVPSLDEAFPFSEVRVQAEGSTSAFGEGVANQYVANNVWWFVDNTPDLVNDNGDYVDGDRETSSLVNPCGGYLVYTFRPCRIVFPDLMLRSGSHSPHSPLDPSPREGPAAVARPEPDWAIQIRAQAGATRDRGVEVGVLETGRKGIDPTDVMKPPFFADRIRVAIIQPDGSWTEFMRAYDAPSDSYHEWNLTVSGPQKLATLHWTGTVGLPVELNVYLVDPVCAHAIDMRAESSFEFVLVDGCRDFTVLVSERPYDGTLLRGSQTAVREVSPNPARGGTNIAYELGKTGPIDLRVFDVSGRQVALLCKEMKDRGRYNLFWEPDRTHLGSGVYFIRLRNGESIDTRRILLIR
jgi:hypothetical protein